jgi:uncharacterized membrane protein
MDLLFAILQRLELEAKVFLVAMVPLIELRGAIPLGMAYGLDWMENFLSSCLSAIFLNG